MVFVSARAADPKLVIYTADDGSETVREGGSRAWRNNNQGNIQKGSFADSQGAIGGDSRFAIFPSETVGRDAVVALLKSPSYVSLTLEKAINRYAPPNENNTAGYVESVSHETAINRQTELSALNVTQLQAIAAAIKKIEGWVVGKERSNKPVA